MPVVSGTNNKSGSLTQPSSATATQQQPQQTRGTAVYLMPDDFNEEAFKKLKTDKEKARKRRIALRAKNSHHHHGLNPFGVRRRSSVLSNPSDGDTNEATVSSLGDTLSSQQNHQQHPERQTSDFTDEEGGRSSRTPPTPSSHSNSLRNNQNHKGVEEGAASTHSAANEEAEFEDVEIEVEEEYEEEVEDVAEDDEQGHDQPPVEPLSEQELNDKANHQSPKREEEGSPVSTRSEKTDSHSPIHPESTGQFTANEEETKQDEPEQLPAADEGESATQPPETEKPDDSTLATTTDEPTTSSKEIPQSQRSEQKAEGETQRPTTPPQNGEQEREPAQTEEPTETHESHDQKESEESTTFTLNEATGSSPPAAATEKEHGETAETVPETQHQRDDDTVKDPAEERKIKTKIVKRTRTVKRTVRRRKEQQVKGDSTSITPEQEQQDATPPPPIIQATSSEDATDGDGGGTSVATSVTGDGKRGGGGKVVFVSEGGASILSSSVTPSDRALQGDTTTDDEHREDGEEEEAEEQEWQLLEELGGLRVAEVCFAEKEGVSTDCRVSFLRPPKPTRSEEVSPGPNKPAPKKDRRRSVSAPKQRQENGRLTPTPPPSRRGSSVTRPQSASHPDNNEEEPKPIIPIGLASYLMNGIRFTSDTERPNVTNRTIAVRIRDIQNPTEGKTKLNVELAPPLIAFCSEGKLHYHQDLPAVLVSDFVSDELKFATGVRLLWDAKSMLSHGGSVKFYLPSLEFDPPPSTGVGRRASNAIGPAAAKAKAAAAKKKQQQLLLQQQKHHLDYSVDINWSLLEEQGTGLSLRKEDGKILYKEKDVIGSYDEVQRTIGWQGGGREKMSKVHLLALIHSATVSCSTMPTANRLVLSIEVTDFSRDLTPRQHATGATAPTPVVVQGGCKGIVTIGVDLLQQPLSSA